MYKNGIGVIYQLKEALEIGADKLVELGLDCVQLQCFTPDLLTRENAEKVKKAMDDAGIRISSFWAGWTGPKIWNFWEGPYTLGLVPEAYRFQRLQELMKGADFAEWLGVKNLATHVGFIPENPGSEQYRSLFGVLKYLVNYCAQKDICFNFETGQETPVALMRMIAELDDPEHTGINLDPANLIIYGKGNPVDALDMFEGYVRGVHVKDANYTKDPKRMGIEQLVGEGQVNYPIFLPKLLKQGYTGDLYIEREIHGDQQIIDIKKTIVYVKEFLNAE